MSGSEDSKQEAGVRKQTAGGRIMPTPLGFRDLKVYQLAYQLAMEIFHESKSFPPEEKLTRGYEEIGRMLGSMILNPERFSV
jgi:hypothetical protein